MTSSNGSLRVALFGSPAFAVPVLEALRAHHQLALVVTQPAKPAGRGMRLRQPATAARAEELGVPLAQPKRLRRNEEFHATLQRLELDVAITAAYGKLLPASLLAVPHHGFLNAHASLLPKYRGAAPIQWALIHGEHETGVSIMQTEVGLDTGPVRHVKRHTIQPHETAVDLFSRLAVVGAEAVTEALALLAQGVLPSNPQDDTAATLAPLLTAEDGRVRWQDAASAVYDRYRGVLAWPGSYFLDTEGARVKVTQMRPAERDPGTARDAMPGTVLRADGDGVLVACGADQVWLERLRPAGRQDMTASSWAAGRGIEPGVRLG